MVCAAIEWLSCFSLIGFSDKVLHVCLRCASRYMSNRLVKVQAFCSLGMIQGSNSLNFCVSSPYLIVGPGYVHRSSFGDHIYIAWSLVGV